MNIKQITYFTITFLFGLFIGLAFNSQEKTKTEEIGLEVENYKSQITGLTQQIDLLEKEKEDLEEQLSAEEINIENITEEVEEEQPLKSQINLLDWSRDEIIGALAAINPDFESGKWFTYIYRGDGSYYDQVGPIFDVDPFSKIAYRERGEEYTVNSLRMFLLNPDKEKAKNAYASFIGEVTKESQLDKDLVCAQQTGCFNIKIIKCDKLGKDYYAWFEGNYLFTTINSGRETLDTFETFYCQ